MIKIPGRRGLQEAQLLLVLQYYLMGLLQELLSTLIRFILGLEVHLDILV